jgi:malonyl CoA-acyl carrier protein transacylase
MVLQIDYNTLAAVASAIVSAFGLGKYAVPVAQKAGSLEAKLESKLETLTQIAQVRGEPMVQAAEQGLKDLEALLQGGAALTPAQLQKVHDDFQTAVSDFKKVLEDAKGLL